MLLGSQAFRRGWGHEGEALTNGIDALVQETRETYLVPPVMWRPREKTAGSGGSSHGILDLPALVLVFPASKPASNTFLLFICHPVYYVRAAWTKTCWYRVTEMKKIQECPGQENQGVQAGVLMLTQQWYSSGAHLQTQLGARCWPRLEDRESWHSVLGRAPGTEVDIRLQSELYRLANQRAPARTLNTSVTAGSGAVGSVDWKTHTHGFWQNFC